MGSSTTQLADDPAEQVARIVAARRAWLLRMHRRRLRPEDLEDCYSQATLELLARARRAPFASREHVLNALEQKFRSRIEDRRRAIGGRSAIEAAIAQAVPVDGAPHDGPELEDRAAGVERLVVARSEMRRVREAMADLTRDQQLVLASQVCIDMDASEFCRRHGWSAEKYRKVAQRARARLRALMEEYERGERCERLRPDLLALAAGTADEQARSRARAHASNCRGCARLVASPARARRALAALAPVPAGAPAAWLRRAWSGVRRAASPLRHPFARAGGSGGAGVAGGSLAGAGATAVKAGIAAICVAGTVGGYAACAHLSMLAGLSGSVATPPHHGGDVPAVRARHAVPPARRRGPAHARGVRTHTPVTLADPVATPPRLTQIAQVRREFGGSRHASITVRTMLRGRSAPPATAPPPAQTPAQVGQTTVEFGFER